MNPSAEDNRKTRPKPRIPSLLLTSLFLASFALCAVFALLARPLPVTDEFLTYYRIAGNISLGRGFTEDGTSPYVYLPPLFSTLLGGWFFVTGCRTLASVQIFQSLCLAASAVATLLLAREVHGRARAAAVPAAWVALHPSLWTYAVFVRQEPTILLLTTLACWLTVRWFAHPGRARGALAGAAWGAATLAKVVSCIAPVLLLGLWIFRRKRDWRASLPEILFAAMAFAAVVAPWTARNYHHFHRLILVNDQGAGLLEWNVQHSDAPVDEGKGLPALLLTLLMTKDATKGDLAGEKFLADLDREGVIGKERTRRLRGYILAHKRYFLAQRIRNAIFLAAPAVDWWIQSGRFGTGEALRSPLFWAFAVLVHVPLLGFLAWRIFRLARGTLSLSLSFLVLFSLAYLALYAVLWGEPRFSIPLYPVLAVLGPWGEAFRKT